MKRLFIIMAVCIMGAALSQPAAARDHRSGHAYGHNNPHNPHYAHHNRINFVFYRPAPVYYYPPVITRTIVIAPPVASRTVIVNQQPIVEAGGDYCREYNTATSIGGLRQASYGTACLMPDGSWKIAD